MEVRLNGSLDGIGPALGEIVRVVEEGATWLRYVAPEPEQVNPQVLRRLRLGEFSKGMRQKIALARALLHDPPVLMLDEPTSAMDPSSARLVRQAILALKQAGRTLLICTHNLAEAEQLADRIAIIRLGQIIAFDTPQALRRRLLGPPLMEVRLNGSLDGIGPALGEIVRVVEEGATWLRYVAPEPEQVNPQVLRRLSPVRRP